MADKSKFQKSQNPRKNTQPISSKAASSSTRTSAASAQSKQISRKIKPKPKGRVELLQEIEDCNVPSVKIERTTSQNVVCLQEAATKTPSSEDIGEDLLMKPKFQSSLAVLEALGKVKLQKIDGERLINAKLREDAKTRLAVEKQAARATTISSTTKIFHDLKSLDINTEQLIENEESRRNKIAICAAPCFAPKEDEPNLSDFEDLQKPQPKPVIPHIGTFNEELEKFAMNHTEPVAARISRDDFFAYKMIM